MSEKSKLFKGIPSLFSRGGKTEDGPTATPAQMNESPAESPVPSDYGMETLTNESRQLIADCQFFDATWYLSQNPDVAGAGVDPLDHYLNSGENEGRNPGPDFDVKWYAKKYPEFRSTKYGALEHYLRYRKNENLCRNQADYRACLEHEPSFQAERSSLKSASLKVYSSPPLIRRINLVLDSLECNDSVVRDASEKEGLLLSCLLAESTCSELRIITRVARAKVSRFRDYLRMQGLQVPAQVEFVFCDYVDPAASVPISQWDLFVTVDNANTSSVLASICEQKVFCLTPSCLEHTFKDVYAQSVIEELSQRCESVFI